MASPLRMRSPGLTCARCGRPLEGRRAFRVRASSGARPRCFACAVRHRPMLKRSLLIAVAVGTVLTAINQGDRLVAGRWDPAFAWKIPLTYLVPFLVATAGALGESRITPPPPEGS